MAWKNSITTSLHGRRFGLQQLSSGQTGGSDGTIDLLVGAEAVRVEHSTADTTSANLSAFGVSVLTTQSSSGVYTLDPPIPGVNKTLVFETTGSNPIYVKTANGEFIGSTQGTTMSVLTSSQTNVAAVTLVPISTAAWRVLGSLSSAFLRTSTST